MELSWRLNPKKPRPISVKSKRRDTTHEIEPAIQDPLVYLPQYQVLICVEHGYAVRDVGQHLLVKHTSTAAQRKTLQQRYQDHPRCSPDQVVTPRPFQPAIPELGCPVKASRCEDEACGFVVVNHDNIRKHANKKHGWRKSPEHPQYWSSVYAQTFFVGGGFTKYFAVQYEHVAVEEAAATSTPVRATLSDDAQEDLQRIKTEWSAARASHEKTLEMLEKDVLQQDRTAWFKRTCWPEHLAKRHLRYLAHATRLPDRDEAVLQEAVRVVDLLMKQAVTGLSTFDIELRRWIKSAQQTEPDQRPIARLQNPESQDRYCGYMKRFMCYCLRVWTSEQELSQRQQSDASGAASTARDDQSGSDDSSSDADSDSDEDDSEDNPDDDGGDGEGVHQPEKPVATDIDPMQDARELFPWHGRQRQAVAELHDTLAEKRDDADDDEVRIQKLAAVLRSFIFHRVGGQQFQSGLIHFLAVLGIDEQNNRLRRATDYSYILAGVVYDVRVLGAEILLPSAERAQQENDLGSREQFLRQRSRFLADGTGTPMSIMISLLAYGKYVAMNTGNTGSVSWSRDKQTLYFRGQLIELSSFRQMIHGAIQATEDMFWRELLWVQRTSERFEVPLHQLVDDVTFTKRGISFISKSSNGLTHGLDWVLQQMMAQLHGKDRLRVNRRWRPRLIRRHLRRIERCLALLLFCIHTTGGQPARGTEVLTIRFRNGSLQDRNVFIIDGQVVVITRYHKSQALFDKPKIIPRFLPWRVGQLLALYLVYLQPFREHLLVQVQGQGWSDHIWHTDKGPWETSRLTDIIAQRTALSLGHRFTTLDYRHIAVSVGRVVVGDKFAAGYVEEIGEVEEPEVEEESGLELQSGRGEAVGTSHYGVPINIIQNLSVRSLETFRPLSEAWHRFLQLASDRQPLLSPSQAISLRSKPSKRAIEEGFPTTSPRKRPSWRSLFNTASQQADTPVASTSPVLSLRPGSASTPLADQQRSELSVDTVAIERAMHQLFGDGPVRFNSREQEEGLHAVLRHETPVVVVLPTGGGKTLLAMVPALLDPEGVTIMVAPFRALVDNMVDRFRGAGVNCLEWKFGEVNPAAVVVVSADVAVSYGFLSYGRLLQQKGLLRRVVIDECHLTFTSHHWRPKLAHLRGLRALNCPMICLTATLPPMLVFELEESLLIRNARIIRAPTIRPQHRYQVQRCRGGELLAQAISICQRRAKHLRQLKGVVYCRSKAQCETLAQELHCGYYHADRVNRAAELEKWVDTGGFIIATSALGTGVDFPGIVFVLHVDMPWSMIDFAQESGRAGRGGEVVDSVILVEEGSVEEQIRRGQLSIDSAAVATFITTGGCRRLVQSEYLDGHALRRSCSDVAGCASCDHCGEGLVEYQEQQRRYAREWDVVRTALDEMAEGCAICWMTVGDGSEQGHGIKSCGRHEAVTAQGLEELRARIRYEGSSHSCYRCGLSQKYCATGEDVELRCQWPQVVMAVVYVAMGDPTGTFRMVQRLGYAGELRDWVAYGKWLGRRHERRVWGGLASNAMAVVVELVLWATGEDR
jgi:superfamily II DNA helicase RecQ